MNLNDFALEVAKREGGKVSVNIAQIKEIVRLTFDILKENKLKAMFWIFKIK